MPRPSAFRPSRLRSRNSCSIKPISQANEGSKREGIKMCAVTSSGSSSISGLCVRVPLGRAEGIGRRKRSPLLANCSVTTAHEWPSQSSGESLPHATGKGPTPPSEEGHSKSPHLRPATSACHPFIARESPPHRPPCPSLADGTAASCYEELADLMDPAPEPGEPGEPLPPTRSLVVANQSAHGERKGRKSLQEGEGTALKRGGKEESGIGLSRACR